MLEPVGPVLTLLGTFGGIWAVVALFRRYQTDFADRYRTELADVRTELAKLREDIEAERRARIAAQVEVGRLQAVLNLHGIKDTRGETP